MKLDHVETSGSELDKVSILMALRKVNFVRHSRACLQGSFSSSNILCSSRSGPFAEREFVFIISVFLNANKSSFNLYFLEI